jgi:hypothetical protein
MSAFVRIAQVSTGTGSVVDVVTSVLSVQPPAHLSDGVCLSATATAIWKVGAEAALSMGVGVAMTAIVLAWLAAQLVRRCASAATSSQSPSRDSSFGNPWWSRRASALPSSSLAGVLLQPLITPHNHRSDPASSQRVDGSTLSSTVVLDVAGGGLVGLGFLGTPSGTQPEEFEADTSNVPLRARLVCAAVNFSTSLYATLTLAAMKLLHCVSVPGAPAGTLWMFIDGTQRCRYLGWQAPLLVALAVLCAMPLALALVARWAVSGRWCWPTGSGATLSSPTAPSPSLAQVGSTTLGVRVMVCAKETHPQWALARCSTFECCSFAASPHACVPELTLRTSATVFTECVWMRVTRRVYLFVCLLV